MSNLPALAFPTNCKITFTATLPVKAYSVQQIEEALDLLSSEERLENFEVQSIEYEGFPYVLYPELDSNIKGWFYTAAGALTGLFIGITLLMSFK